MRNKLINSTLILLIGGFITKVFGMFIRITTTRLIGLEGMSIYMLIMPTFSLFMTLSQLSLPTAISKLVSEDKHNNKNIVFSTIPLTLIVNFILMIIIFMIAKPVSIYLLKDERCLLPILSIALVLPFDSISNLLRGYFFGKQRMFPHVVSHIFEQLVRFTLICIFIPTLSSYNLIYAVSFLVAINMISETLSIFVLFIFIPKNFKLRKSDVRPNRSNIKDVLLISVPTTISRLIGNIGMFLEPIIINFSFLAVGISKTFIQEEYAIINGYVLPLILLPGFFTGAISSALLPEITKNYANKNYKAASRKLKLGIFLSLIVGIPVTLILFIFPDTCLKLLYNTSLGTNYLKFSSIFFILYYIEGPLSSCLQAMDKSKNIMIDNIIGISVKILILLIFPFLGFSSSSIMIATISYVAVVTLRHFYAIKKAHLL